MYFRFVVASLSAIVFACITTVAEVLPAAPDQSKEQRMDRISTRRKTFRTAKGKEFQVTIFTIAGTAPGPVLGIVAGQHGMEHSGPNLLPELMTELAGRDFAGTVHVCPCANPLALEMDYEFYPENEDLSKINDHYYSIFRHNYCPWGLGRDNGDTWYNMNRLWGRKEIHGVAGEITKWLWQEVCADADIILDLHCLQAEKPLIFNSFDKNIPIARYAGIEAIFMCDQNPNDSARGNLTWVGSQAEKQYAICLEFSRQHGLKESEYELGKQAIRNVMTGANMLPGEVVLTRPVWVVPTRNNGGRLAVRHTGHIRYTVELYDHVRKGDKLYEVRDIQTVELLEEGFAPNDGIVAGIAHQPVIRPDIMPCWVPEVVLAAEAGRILPKLPRNFFKNK